MPVTPVYALRYQSLSDPPHGPNLGQHLALDVEDELVRIDTAAALLGGRVTTVEQKLTQPTLTDIQNTSGTTTSTSYTFTLAGVGAVGCGLAFVAPPSGKVLIFNELQLNIATLGFAFCAVNVKTGSVIGSGSDVIAPSDDEAVTNDLVQRRFGVSRLVTGLTPGGDYNVKQAFKSSSGNTATFVRKQLIVQPQVA